MNVHELGWFVRFRGYGIRLGSFCFFSGSMSGWDNYRDFERNQDLFPGLGTYSIVCGTCQLDQH